MDNYEKTLLQIVMNAGEKLIDAMALHTTGYSYRSSWVLAVIAEEEIAKLIIIPFAKLAGTTDQLSDRKSVVYKHPIKQKIFATFGLQNRNFNDIEKLKQSYLYTSPDFSQPTSMPVVSKKASSEEIIHAVKLFDQIVVLNLLSSETLSDDFKKHLKKYFENIYIPAVKQLHPEAADAMKKKYDVRPTDVYEIIKAHPMLFAEMVTYAIPDTYEEYFRSIEGKSFEAAIQTLDKYLEGKGFLNSQQG